jgi:LCP family protein required for cell wall assembly
MLFLIKSNYEIDSNIYKAANKSYHPIERAADHSKLRDQTVAIGKNPISILLMGVEDYSSGGKDGRTDTIIVITLNPSTKKMTMTSIPRDSYVPIASRGGKLDKINAAYAYGSANGYGGVKGTIDTVENLLNIPIDYYVTVGFSGFAKVIDELGGVDVNVPFNFWEKDIFNHNQRIYFKKGLMHLNGEQALAYVRMRKRDPRGDFGRNDRQRQVIQETISKAISAKTLFKVDELASIMENNIQTNLKPIEIYDLERTYSKMDPLKIESIRLDDKGHDATINLVYS